jgi:hypothetical protein
MSIEPCPSLSAVWQAAQNSTGGSGRLPKWSLPADIAASNMMPSCVSPRSTLAKTSAPIPSNDPTTSMVEPIRTGKLRALAVTTATRSPALPDIPTVGEFVPGYEVSGWQGIGAPKNTPSEIVDGLNKEINAGLADPKIKAWFSDLGGTVLTGSPADFGKLIADETEVGQGDPRGQHKGGMTFAGADLP